MRTELGDDVVGFAGTGACLEQVGHFAEDRGLFLEPFQFPERLCELLIGEAQVLFRLLTFGHVPSDAGKPVWPSAFTTIDFAADGQIP
jgi:hypothetical protein